MQEHFDAVVIGTGPAGEVAVSRLAEQGLRVALAERELIGGECAYWACIPSKTLLRTPEARAGARRAAGVDEPEQHWPDVAAYRDFMIRQLDDSEQVEGYERQGVTVIKGAARIAGPGRVEVGDRVLKTERIVIATGSDPVIPPIDGLEEAGYWTNREATTVSELPSSLVVLGGGPVGVELAQLFRRFGVDVTLVQSPDRLLNREDPAVGELIGEVLAEEGIDVRLGARAERVRRDGARRVVALAGGDEVTGHDVLVATGRTARVEGIDLENVGVEPGPQGVPIDGRCRAADGVWAIGDVTGVMPFTHVPGADRRGGHRRGRCRSGLLGDPTRRLQRPGDRRRGPDAGAGARAGSRCCDVAGQPPEVIARPWTYERDPRGELGLVADRGRVGGGAACRRVDPPSRARRQDAHAAGGSARHRRAVPHVQRSLPQGTRAARVLTRTRVDLRASVLAPKPLDDPVGDRGLPRGAERRQRVEHPAQRRDQLATLRAHRGVALHAAAARRRQVAVEVLGRMGLREAVVEHLPEHRPHDTPAGACQRAAGSASTSSPST